MKMKRFALILPTALALVLAACGNEQQEATLAPSVPVEAVFTMEPREPVSGETVTFAVTVTQEGQPVDDASEVSFEWWKEGDAEHQTVPATFQKDGLYIAKQTVDEPGSYFVYYHVTARDFHTMKQFPFTVKSAEHADTQGGHSAGATSDAAATDAGHGHAEGHGHGHTADSGHGQQVDIRFAPSEGIRASQEATLAVQITKDNEALPNATVRFEYWREGEEKHIFLDAAESQPGQYEANVSLPASGTYTVKVHVQAPGIHDHKEFPLSVQ